MAEQKQWLRGLRPLRRSAGLSQRDLGKRVGLGQDAISLYELGKRVPHPRHQKAIADALGVHVWDLFTDQPTLFPKGKGPAQSRLTELVSSRAGNPIWLLSADELKLRANTSFALRTVVNELATTQRIVRQMLREPGLERNERKALQRHARNYTKKIVALSMRAPVLLEAEARQLTEELEGAMDVEQQEVNA